MNFCKHCGNLLDENASFCDICGEPVSQPEADSNTGFFSKIIFELERNKTFAAALAVLLAISLGIVTFCLLQVLSSSGLKSAKKDENSTAAEKSKDKIKSNKTDNEVVSAEKSVIAKFSEVADSKSEFDRLQTRMQSKAKSYPAVNMKYISSDVSEYPLIKIYYQLIDANGNSIILNSPSAAIRESVAGGAYIEREVKRIEKLKGNQGLSIDIIADKSGSMGTDMPKVQNVMSQFISSLDYQNGDQAELLAFEGNVMYMCSYTKNTSLLNNGISSLSAYGDTALYDACIEGIRNASGQAGAKCVIVFTDGQDNASLHNAQEVINYAVSSSVPLYIIGAGDADSYGLTDIANRTGGRYWNINDLYDMSQILQSIYTEQKDLYCLEYVTDTNVDAYTQRTASCIILDDNYGVQNESSFTPSKVIQHAQHNNRYEAVKNDISWMDANINAIQQGGHLVTITSQQEMNDIINIAQGAGLKYVWIGGYTMITNGYCYGHWITGEDFNQYSAWYPGEPSRNDRDGTEEKYLMLWNVEGNWSWNDERNDPAHDPKFTYFLGKTGYVIEYEN